jgi:hypothetical protein
LQSNEAELFNINKLETKENIMNAKTNIKDGSIEDLEKLKELGFDINDFQKFTSTWLQTIQDREKLKRICEIIFENPEGTYNLAEIFQGLKSFFENIGVFFL